MLREVGGAVKTYRVNEIFGSVQGEGARAGTWNVFLRLSKCNMRCSVEPGDKSPGGFDCDTEFESGRAMTTQEIVAEVLRANDGCRQPWVILTGGEPALQVDLELIGALCDEGFRIAIETNGSIQLPVADWDWLRERFLGACPNRASPLDADPIPESEAPNQGGSQRARSYPFDWIVVSPKVAEHAIRQRVAHEIRYVRSSGQSVPASVVKASKKFVSPAFRPDGTPDPEAVLACSRIVRDHPEWRVSMQAHKNWGVR